MERQAYKLQLDQLGDVILDAIAYFSAWRGLMVEDEDSARGLNRYIGFFLPARNALLWMTLMQLAKVFDRHHSTVSLTNLLTTAKKDRQNLIPYATDESLRQIDGKISASQDLLERLKALRDQRIAHHDAIVARDASLPYGQVRDLVEDVKSMYNLLTTAHENSETDFEAIADDAETHTTQVVRVIRDQVEALKAKRHAEREMKLRSSLANSDDKLGSA